MWILALLEREPERLGRGRVKPVDGHLAILARLAERIVDALALLRDLELRQAVGAGDHTEDSHGVLDPAGCDRRMRAQEAHDRRLALAGEERWLEIEELPRDAQQPGCLAERQPQADAAVLRDRSRTRLVVEVARRPDQQRVGELAAELLRGQSPFGRDLADVARGRRPRVAQGPHRGLELLVREWELEGALRRRAVRGPGRDRIAPTCTRRELDPEVVVLVGSHRVLTRPSRPGLSAP